MAVSMPRLHHHDQACKTDPETWFVPCLEAAASRATSLERVRVQIDRGATLSTQAPPPWWKAGPDSSVGRLVVALGQLPRIADIQLDLPAWVGNRTDTLSAARAWLRTRPTVRAVKIQ